MEHACKSPNDRKLSDGGGWRDGCAGEGGGAASVTAGAVRCSAVFGVAVVGRNRRATTGQNRPPGKTGEATKAKTLGLAESVQSSERQTVGLSEDMKPVLAKPCVSEPASRLGTLPDAAPASKPLATQAARVTGAAPAGKGGGEQVP